MRLYKHVAILSVIFVLLDYSSSKSVSKKVKNLGRDDDGNIIKSDGGNKALAGMTNYDLNVIRANGTLKESKVLKKRPKKALKDRFKNPIFDIVFSKYKVQAKDKNLKKAANYSIKFNENKIPKLKPNKTTRVLTSDSELKTEKKNDSKNTSRSEILLHHTGLNTRFGSSRNEKLLKNVDPTKNETASATVQNVTSSLNTKTQRSTGSSSTCLSHYVLCNPGPKARNGGCCFGMICAKTTFGNVCLYYGWNYTRARREQSNNVHNKQKVHRKNVTKRKTQGKEKF